MPCMQLGSSVYFRNGCWNLCSAGCTLDSRRILTNPPQKCKGTIGWWKICGYPRRVSTGYQIAIQSIQSIHGPFPLISGYLVDYPLFFFPKGSRLLMVVCIDWKSFGKKKKCLNFKPCVVFGTCSAAIANNMVGQFSSRRGLKSFGSGCQQTKQLVFMPCPKLPVPFQFVGRIFHNYFTTGDDPPRPICLE